MSGEIETANGSEPMRVTLGEVYRAVLRVESGLKEHEAGHVSSQRWQITTLIALGGMALAIAKLFAPVAAS